MCEVKEGVHAKGPTNYTPPSTREMKWDLIVYVQSSPTNLSPK